MYSLMNSYYINTQVKKYNIVFTSLMFGSLITALEVTALPILVIVISLLFLTALVYCMDSQTI